MKNALLHPLHHSGRIIFGQDFCPPRNQMPPVVRDYQELSRPQDEDIAFDADFDNGEVREGAE